MNGQSKSAVGNHLSALPVTDSTVDFIVRWIWYHAIDWALQTEREKIQKHSLFALCRSLSLALAVCHHCDAMPKDDLFSAIYVPQRNTYAQITIQMAHTLFSMVCVRYRPMCRCEKVDFFSLIFEHFLLFNKELGRNWVWIFQCCDFWSRVNWAAQSQFHLSTFVTVPFYLDHHFNISTMLCRNGL